MVLGGVVEGRKNPVKIRAQWPVVIPGGYFFVSILGLQTAWPKALP